MERQSISPGRKRRRVKHHAAALALLACGALLPAPPARADDPQQPGHVPKLNFGFVGSAGEGEAIAILAGSVAGVALLGVGVWYFFFHDDEQSPAQAAEQAAATTISSARSAGLDCGPSGCTDTLASW